MYVFYFMYLRKLSWLMVRILPWIQYCCGPNIAAESILPWIQYCRALFNDREKGRIRYHVGHLNVSCKLEKWKISLSPSRLE